MQEKTKRRITRKKNEDYIEILSNNDEQTFNKLSRKNKFDVNIDP